MLGEYGTRTLEGMATRGCDSAGLAAYTDQVGEDGARKISLYSPEDRLDWRKLADGLRDELGREVTLRENGNHAVLIPHESADRALEWVTQSFPEAHVLSVGHSIEVYKDIGHPTDIARYYGFRGLSGSHVVAYVAVSSEFCSLAHLPDIDDADIFEPMPEEIHVWNKRSATLNS